MLAAAQGVDFHAPLKTSPMLTQVHQTLRDKVTFYDKDRFFAPDIEAAKELVVSGRISAECQHLYQHLYLA